MSKWIDSLYFLDLAKISYILSNNGNYPMLEHTGGNKGIPKMDIAFLYKLNSPQNR